MERVLCVSKFSSVSLMSKGMALLCMLKQNKSKAKTKIEAVAKQVFYPHIGQNPRVIPLSPMGVLTEGSAHA